MSRAILRGLSCLALLAGAAAHAGDDEAAAQASEYHLALRLDALQSRGGLRDGGGAMSHLDLSWKGDLGALWGWTGAQAYVNLIDDRGDAVNARHTGSLLGVSNIEVARPTHRFLHAWVDQALPDTGLSALVGLYAVDSEFAVLDAAAPLVAPACGALPDYGLSRSPSIFNNSSFGTRLKWRADAAYAMAAVLDGRPGSPRDPVGTHVRFDRGDGAQVLAEAGYSDSAGDGPVPVAKYALGLWHYTSRMPDLADAALQGAPAGRRSTGWYVLAAHRVAEGVDGFARYSANDGHTVPLSSALNLGLRWAGPWPGRADDVLGLAWTRAATAGAYRRAQALAGAPATSSESSLELSYQARLAPALTLEPTLQFLRHPGAVRHAADARVAGVRLELAL
jgi:porin